MGLPEIQHKWDTARKRSAPQKGPHACHYCGKVFHIARDCRRHEMIHTGEKPFKCGVCGKCFNRDSHLNIHLRSHTGEKPFKCSLCEKNFSQRCNLTNHMKSKHERQENFIISKNVPVELNMHTLTTLEHDDDTHSNSGQQDEYKI